MLETLSPILVWIAFVLGLCIGSFLNVVGLRLLSETSIAFPSSHCPECKAPIRWHDNIPVLGYLMLGGQCRDCSKPISIQYPIVELSTALLFAFIVSQFGVSWESAGLMFLVANLVVVTITDFRESWIFLHNTVPLVPVGLVYSWFDLGHLSTTTYAFTIGSWMLTVPESFVSAILGVIAAIVLFEGLILIGRVLLGVDTFGHGDTLLMMGVGAFVGWKLVLLAILAAFILQGILGIPLVVVQFIKHKAYDVLVAGTISVLGALGTVWLTILPVEPQSILMWMYALTLLTLVAIGFFLFLVRKHEIFTYVPLGPVLVLGSLIMVFWGKPVLDVLGKVLSPV